MIPAAFDYVRAATLEDALERLAAAPWSVRPIAGGQSLLPLMKLRLARPEALVDIGRLDGLRGVRRLPDGRVAVGSLTTYDESLRDPVLARYGLLADALPRVGDVQVRNRGTIGGAIAHADPASDVAPLILALEAEIVARSVRGERVVPAVEFFIGPFTTALEPDELIVEIRLPAGRNDVGSAYRSVEQPASGYAIAGAAAIVGEGPGDGGSGPWRLCRVAVTGVGDRPYRATAVEEAVRAGASFEEAATHAIGGQSVASDIHADREYRAHLAAVEVRRALEAAAARA